MDSDFYLDLSQIEVLSQIKSRDAMRITETPDYK